MTNATTAPPTSAGRKFLSGGAVLLVSMTVVNAGNYLYNLILGRWLGPTAFADLSLIVTLMLMVTFITATLQLTTAKFAANFTADGTPEKNDAMRRWLGRYTLIGGSAISLLMILGAPLWQQFFHMQSFWPFVILGVGMPIYFIQGIDRGILQGQTRFGVLSLSYLAEMVARLGFGLAFVALGFGVNGAVTGITLSFVATWLVAHTATRSLPHGDILSSQQRSTIKSYATPVIFVYVSQILINNSDILIVKRFFEGEEAGLYAALALIGRVVFFATWSVVTVLFPIVAQKHRQGEAHRHLLYAGLGIVSLISAAILAGTLLFPELIVNVLFGNAYLSIAPLLWLYALATMLYALANVVVNYRLSADNSKGVTIALIAGVVQVILLWIFHDSLYQVVVVQIILMGVFFAVLMVWDQLTAYRERQASPLIPPVPEI